MRPDTELAIKEFSATAEGWCTVERALEMAQLILDNPWPSQTVVEIGVFAGGSLIPQALALKELDQSGHIYGIDPWSRQAAIEQVFVANDQTPAADEEIARKWWAEVDLDKMHSLAMQGIWRYVLEAFAVVIRARSEQCSELFSSIDILYIDGSHSEEASCRDVNLYMPKVRSGGFIWIDDANWQTVKKATELLEAECALERDHEQYRLYRKK
jgi:predicted O-methyltransferase YrrM